MWWHTRTTLAFVIRMYHDARSAECQIILNYPLPPVTRWHYFNPWRLWLLFPEKIIQFIRSQITQPCFNYTRSQFHFTGIHRFCRQSISLQCRQNHRDLVTAPWRLPPGVPLIVTSYRTLTNQGEVSWNVMAHAQKPDFVSRRNVRVHLKQRWRQLCRLLAAELCASAVVMLDTPCSEVVWRVLAIHSIHQVSPSLLPCVTVCHHIATGVYLLNFTKRIPARILCLLVEVLQQKFANVGGEWLSAGRRPRRGFFWWGEGFLSSWLWTVKMETAWSSETSIVNLD